MTPATLKTLSPLDRLVWFITERESIRLKRAAGEKPPWTDDPILSAYRFCNVRRADDRVSQWLLHNWYMPYRDHPNTLAAAALARFFNLPSTLAAITDDVYRDGEPLWDEIKAKVRNLKADGRTVFNAAYVVRGNDEVDKVECVVDYYVRPMIAGAPAIDTASMELSHAAILPAYGFGSFMAGQLVADLRWALTGTWEDRLTWAPVGPGSVKGLNRLMGRPENTPVNQFQFSTELRDVVSRLRADLQKSIASRMEAHDFQNTLCELSKFEKALWGDGKPKQLYRTTDL